jgi:glutamine---fructose-6-phosphate transaminase (isomerizing)
MIRCRRCIIPENYPFTIMDSQGICNHCLNYKSHFYEGNESLKEVFKKIKSHGKEYDCLIGLSGGRDSSYLAYKAVKEWNLNILAYCYDNGHMTESAKENVKKISEKLGIKIIIVDSAVDRNRELFRKIFSAWVSKPSVQMLPALCIGCRSGIRNYAERIAAKSDIHYLLDGGNNYEDTSHKLGFLGIDSSDYNMLLSNSLQMHSIRLQILNSILKEIAKNPRYLSPSLLVYGLRDFLEGIRPVGGKDLIRIRPFTYEKLDEPKMMKTLTDELGWQYPSYFAIPWRSDCEIAILKTHLYLKLVGFSDYDAMVSNMIRDNSISRDAALEFISSAKLENEALEKLLESEGIANLIPKDAKKLGVI